MRSRQLAPATSILLVLVFGASGCGNSGSEAAAVGSPDAFDASGGGAAPGPSGTLVAFAGAEGFGSQARGGRGGSVCHVTTLDDAGTGSLRECVSAPNRTVVFDVSGWITLASELPVLAVGLTIAGQTAPGQGVGVRGNKVAIGGRDIIVRFLRARRGVLTNTTRDDAMIITPSAVDVIVDHCSVAFGTDETLSIPGDTPSGPSNVTLQWSIVAWGLQRNNHSAGSLLAANRTSVHHTLWAFNKTRNPRARSSQAAIAGDSPLLDWVNNVTAGWDARDPVGEQNGWSLSHHPFIMGGTESGTHFANAVGNYFVSSRAASYAFVEGTPNFQLYAADNLLDGNANGELDVSASGTELIEGTPSLLAERLGSADASAEVETDAAADAYARVLTGAGAVVPARDELDALLVARVREQSGDLIQSEADLAAAGIGGEGYGALPALRRSEQFDPDGDGMPSAWELENGLDPADATDGNADGDADGYTNLEEYLAALVPAQAWGR